MVARRAEKKARKCGKCVKCSRAVYCSDMCRNHFTDYFEKKVKKTVKKFGMFSKKHKVGVGASGGKDSTTLLFVLKRLGYKVEAITANSGIPLYSDKNLRNLRSMCDKYGIRLTTLFFRDEFGGSLSKIMSALSKKGLNYSHCFVCGVLRRYVLNKYAKKQGFDCLATGHNLDDEAQSFVMNVFRNDLTLAKRQGPVSGESESKLFVKRVKPLYFCSEKEITAYSKLMKLPVNFKPCPHRRNSYRREYADMLDRFEKKYPPTKHNIIRFFLRTIHKMKDKDIDKEVVISTCEKCGEPCADKLCKKCQILGALKSK